MRVSTVIFAVVAGLIIGFAIVALLEYYAPGEPRPLKVTIMDSGGAHLSSSTVLPAEVQHKTGAQCPAGWKERPGFFTEKDGSTKTACVATPAVKDVVRGETDYLLAGESFRFEVSIPR